MKQEHGAAHEPDWYESEARLCLDVHDRFVAAHFREVEEPMPGATYMLRALKRRGYLVAVASSYPKAMVDHCMEVMGWQRDGGYALWATGQRPA